MTLSLVWPHHRESEIRLIVDVHTHTPRHRTPPPAGATADTAWRPDQTRPTSLTWDDQMAALEVVDRAIVFNIAADPRRPGEEVGSHVRNAAVNDDTAAFVRAFPES